MFAITHAMEEEQSHGQTDDFHHLLNLVSIDLPSEVSLAILQSIFPTITNDLSLAHGSYKEIQNIKSETVDAIHLLAYLRKKGLITPDLFNLIIAHKKKDWDQLQSFTNCMNIAGFLAICKAIDLFMGEESLDSDDEDGEIAQVNEIIAPVKKGNELNHIENIIKSHFFNPNKILSDNRENWHILLYALNSAKENNDQKIKEIIALLLKLGANPNIPNTIDHQNQKYRVYPLSQALALTQIDTAELLLTYQANPNQPSTNPASAIILFPLVSALTIDSKEMVKALLEHGADPRKMVKKHESIIVYAKNSNCSQAIIKLLEEREAELSQQEIEKD